MHATITAICLWNLGNYWWAFWSYHDVAEWTSVRFFLVLLIVGLHYSIATLLVSSTAASVRSWREHYYEIRVRLFSVALLWMLLLSVQGWLLLDLPWWSPARLIELVGLVTFALGVSSANPRLHTAIAAVMAASAVVLSAPQHLGAALLP